MGRQHINEGDMDEELRDQLAEQIADLAEEGYDAEEIAEFMAEQGYDVELYREIMDEQGIEIATYDRDEAETDNVETVPWDDSYNDDSYEGDGDF